MDIEITSNPNIELGDLVSFEGNSDYRIICIDPFENYVLVDPKQCKVTTTGNGRLDSLIRINKLTLVCKGENLKLTSKY